MKSTKNKLKKFYLKKNMSAPHLLINNNINKLNNAAPLPPFSLNSSGSNESSKKNIRNFSLSYNNLKHNHNLRFFLNTKTEELRKKNKIIKQKQEEYEERVNMSVIRPAVKGDDGQIDKRILPFFSVPVMLKNINDRKKNKNFNILKPKKKLMYKVIKLNKTLEKLVISIKQYKLNLNSFKGSKLDFILFLRNNLYFNLKIIFSNISYKIDFIKAVAYNNNIIEKNNYNTIEFPYYSGLPFQRKGAEAGEGGINKLINKRTKIYKLGNAAATKLKNKNVSVPFFMKRTSFLNNNISTNKNKSFLENIKTILNNYSISIMMNNQINNSFYYSASLPTLPLIPLESKSNAVKRKDITHLFVFKRLLKPLPMDPLKRKPSLPLGLVNVNLKNGKIQISKEIRYLLLKLNNLLKKIEHIINIININEIFLKKIKIINNSIINSINNDNNNNNYDKLNKKFSFAFFKKAAGDNSITMLRQEKDLYKDNISSNLDNNYNKDLYLQISNGVVAENKIKIEETIKSISNNVITDNLLFNNSLLKNTNIINTNENNKEVPSLQDKGISINKFDWKVDPISINSNPVDLLYFNNNINKPIINDYLKSMSIYNMNRNGTIMYFSNIIGFNFYNRNLRPEAQNIYKLLYSSFRSMYCLISKPVFIIKSNKIIIQLFYFLLVPRLLKYKKRNKKGYLVAAQSPINKKNIKKRNKKNINNTSSYDSYGLIKNKQNKVLNSLFKRKKRIVKLKKGTTNFNPLKKYYRRWIKKFIKNNSFSKREQLIKLDKINLIKLYPLKFKKLCEVLNNFFNKPVELDLIRLHYPYNNSNILVRLLAFMINKIKIRRITRKLFKNAVIKSIKKINNKDKTNLIPAFLSGLNIKVAGRLMKYRVIPRKTVRIVRRGSSSVGKINYTDFSRYTNKNKRGAFSIYISSGQNFF